MAYSMGGSFALVNALLVVAVQVAGSVFAVVARVAAADARAQASWQGQLRCPGWAFCCLVP